MGIIKTSNLCKLIINSIIQYFDKDYTAVSNLASINLIKMINNNKLNFNILRNIVELAVINLNKIININTYPYKKSEKSSKETRSIGIGVQGLSDVFQKLNYSFEDKEVKILNMNIFEIIYFSGLKTNYKLAKT